ncbi:MAG: hypothetical protein ACRD1P_05925 [Thermoanaerobaculia bacterium]
MRTRPALFLAAAALLLYALRHPIELRLLRHAAATPPDTSGDPVQLEGEKGPFEFSAGGKRYRITPRFRWDESARVVGAEAYHFGKAASLIPEDFALAWGPVLSPPYAGRIHYSQYARFYFWGTKDSSLDRRTIITHTANTHILPASSRLRTAAACVSRGDEVRLEGWLVDVDGIDDPKFHWATSTTREDEGPASCETVFLTRLTINRRVYE